MSEMLLIFLVVILLFSLRRHPPRPPTAHAVVVPREASRSTAEAQSDNDFLG